LLKIYVNDTDYPGLRTKYEDARDTHNAKVFPYLEGNNTSFDTGFDLFLPTTVTVPAGTYSKKVPHGVYCEMLRIGERLAMRDEDNELQIEADYPGRNVGFYMYVRSSTGAKTPLRLSNHVGIIDAPYRGEIMALFDNISAISDVECPEHQRLVQVCAPEPSFPIFVELVDGKEQLGKTDRGEGGLGSTGQ
jgi:dUTP pyrophosphatase